jgi:hypothetical protein
MDEELAQILANAELDDNAKADAIKGLVGKNFIPTAKFNDEKTKQKQAYNALKSEYETFKETKMTDEEKQAEQARVQSEEYKKVKMQLNEMTAKNIFSEAGFKKEEYGDLLSSIVQEDSEKTKTLAETICNTMLSQRKELEKQITDKIVKGTQKPPAGNDNEGGEKTDLEKYKSLLSEAQKSNDMLKVAYFTRLIQQEQQKNEE